MEQSSAAATAEDYVVDLALPGTRASRDVAIEARPRFKLSHYFSGRR